MVGKHAKPSEGVALSKRWTIYRSSGDVIGPLSAMEIRDALRSGQLEAFDQAQAEGYEQRLEILEIDEIFAPAPPPPSQSPIPLPEQATAIIASPQPAPSQRQTPPPQGRAEAAPPPEPQPAPAGGARYLGLADPSVEQGTHAQGRGGTKGRGTKPGQRPEEAGRDEGRKERKYYLLDKNRKKNGPFTAAEIHSLFTQHHLSDRLNVRKKGTKLEVSLRQFISTYEASLSAGKHKSQALRGMPTQQAAYVRPTAPMQGVPARRRALRPLLLGLLGLTVLGLGSYALYLSPLGRSLREPASSSSRPSLPRAGGSNSSESGAEAGANGDGRKKEAEGLNMLDAQNLRKASSPSNKSTSNEASSPAAITGPASDASALNTQTPSEAPQEAENYINSLRNTRAKNGQVVTAGPLRFSERSLKNCPVKCTLAMRDGAGRTIVVKFFKDAYIGPLTGKGSAVYVTGLLSDLGKSLYLSRVH